MQLRAALIAVLSNISEKDRQTNVGQSEWWMDGWIESLLLRIFVCFPTRLMTQKKAGCVSVGQESANKKLEKGN